MIRLQQPQQTFDDCVSHRLGLAVLVSMSHGDSSLTILSPFMCLMDALKLA